MPGRVMQTIPEESGVLSVEGAVSGAAQAENAARIAAAVRHHAIRFDTFKQIISVSGLDSMIIMNAGQIVNFCLGKVK